MLGFSSWDRGEKKSEIAMRSRCHLLLVTILMLVLVEKIKYS